MEHGGASKHGDGSDEEGEVGIESGALEIAAASGGPGDEADDGEVTAQEQDEDDDEDLDGLLDEIEVEDAVEAAQTGAPLPSLASDADMLAGNAGDGDDG